MKYSLSEAFIGLKFVWNLLGVFRKEAMSKFVNADDELVNVNDEFMKVTNEL